MDTVSYTDGDYLRGSDIALAEFMSQNGIADKITKKITFAGIINFEDRLYFFWPKNFQDNLNSGTTKNGCLLINCIRKYAVNRGSTISFGGNADAEPIGIPPAIAMDILEDFMRYGLYRNPDAVIKKGISGKVLWSKVLKDVLPVFQQNQSPVYTDFFVRKVNYDAGNDITLIHAHIVSTLDKIFGWYFTDSMRGMAPELKNAKLPFSKLKALSILRKERSRVFSDRETRLIGHLIRILEKENLFGDHSNFYSGMTGFEHIWEDMCGACFDNEVSFYSEFLPFPAYVSNSTLEMAINNRQRLDIIFRQDNDVAVLDAKYYDFRYSKPGWGDLVKQFYYKRSLEAVLENVSVHNFFVAPDPGSQNALTHAVVVNKSGKRLDHEFGPIRMIYLDVQEVMTKYTNSNMGKDFRELVFPKAISKAA